MLDNIRHQNIADLLSTCFRMFLVLAMVVFFIGGVVGSAFLWRVSPRAGYHEIEIAWIIFLFGAGINLLGGGIFASLYGLGNVATERSVRAMAQLFGLALSYIFLYAGFGIIGLSIAWTSQTLLGRVVAAIQLYRHNPWLRTVRGSPRKHLYGKLIGPSLKWATMGLGVLLILQTDKIIIASILGPAWIPQYEAVAKIALSLVTFSLLMVNTTTPLISRCYAAGDMNAVHITLLRNVRISMATMVFFGAFLAVFGKGIVNLWLGAGNFVGFPVLWTMLVMAFLEVHHSALAAGTMATGHLAFTRIAIVAGVLNVFIALALVRHLGLWGVALGTMTAQMLTNNWFAPVVTLRHFGISWKRYVKSIIVPVIGMLLACLAWNIIISYLLQGGATFWHITKAIVCSAMLGVVVFYRIILTRNERNEIRTWLAYSPLPK